MTTTAPATTSERAPMTPMRKTALIAGVAYIATFVFSIPVKFGLWTGVLDDRAFVLGAGSDAGVPLGAAFEVLTALGGVVTAVALYAVARRYSERAALGFVATRLIEAGMILVGVLSILSVSTLRQEVAGTPGVDPDTLLVTGDALVAIHDWAFLIGPGLMAALNALLIGSVMYRSGLVSRWIPTLGLIGAPLLLVSTTATLFGVWDQVSGIALVLVLPIAIWEFSFGVHLAVKGFKPVAIPGGSASAVGTPTVTGVAG
jgi:hypothetical protein